ncbi:TonB family protein [Nodularia spumigena CS-588/06]|uniref:energy transducer TonB n=2 Tax=Nodularia spumigena TaxID=70799 RepID=UPI00232EAB42|nr:energy transducer TonB [Nodularia spumigena]MDB9344797.1 TonB family protein [Nodularia spumigena CS-588/06]
MSFSGITVKHRSQEVEALKTFLMYSLIGSLTLHIGLLASGIGSLLVRVPKEQYEPIELVILDPVDPPEEKPEKPPEIIPEKIKIPEPTKIVTSRVTPITPVKIEPTFSQPAVAPQQQQPTVTPPAPKVESVKAPPVPQPTQPTVSQPPPPTTSPRQESVAKLESLLTSTTRSSESPIAVPQTNQASEQLRGTLSGLRDSRVTQSSNTVASGTVTNNNTNNNTSNNTRVQRSPVAVAPTAPSTPQIKTQPQNNSGGNSRGSGDGRAACTQCSASYPEFAKRRGIEGRVEVAVDTDAKGNVTNVRIVNSSGDSRLDKETLRQARNWKLKPSENGRQGVPISTNFALEGSRRHRQLQERKKKEQEQARLRSLERAASSSTPTPSPNTPATNTTSEPTVRARREITPTAPAAPVTRPAAATPVRQPRQQNTAAGSSSGTTTTPTPSQSNVRNSLRDAQRQRTSTNSAPAPAPRPAPAAVRPAPRPAPAPAPAAQPSTNRRPRPTASTPAPAPAPTPPANTSSSSQNQLRNSLRRSREAAPSEPASEE